MEGCNRVLGCKKKREKERIKEIGGDDKRDWINGTSFFSFFFFFRRSVHRMITPPRE